ncbi:MAG: hypothetical protein AB9869_28605 [Verrucomicrobiia bacterium]
MKTILFASRSGVGCGFLRLMVPALILLGIAIRVFAQSDPDYFADADYRNRVYDPAPDLVSQTKAVAIFGGHIGALGNTPAPNDGTLYLIRSAFGQPVANSPKSDFRFGEEIVPEAALSADTNAEPIIKPQQKAFCVQDAGGTYRVFASDPGFVSITWKQVGGGSVGPIEYLIDSRPVRTPVAVYHTHNPTPNPGSDFKLNPLPIPQTKAPLVDVSGVQEILFLWNTALTNDLDNPYFVRTPNNTLYAKDKEGLILLEYRENGQFLGIEIVALRSNLVPDGPPTLAEIGFQLSPFTMPLDPVPPRVINGLGTASPESQFIYQHAKPSSRQNGSLFAIRKAANPEDIEVYWMTRSLKNVEWPYEFHRYTNDWPAEPAKYQRYVRGSVQTPGPDVEIPANLNAALMSFQDPPGHAQALVRNRFSTLGPGRSLLQYLPGDDVSFQLILSVEHNDAQFELAERSWPISWPIGQEITELTHEGPKGGYIFAPEGNRYDREIYEGATHQVFAVNTGVLEVWWSNLNQGVQWPSLVKRYTNEWPANAEKIVIASLKGSGPIDPQTDKDFQLYYQNDPSQPGFNPNDEHALIRNSAIFALRDDLGTAETSEPYVLLKFQNDNLWRFRVFAVAAEGMGQDGVNYRFDYTGAAATPIQPPFPLSLFSSSQTDGVSGPFWQDRKGAFWAKAAGDDGGPATIVMRYFYGVQAGFYFPSNYFNYFPAGLSRTNLPSEGASFPWLDVRADSPGTPHDVRYTINWPEGVPQLRVGETLVKSKYDLPDISVQSSVEVLYQQAVARGQGESVQLIDPTKELSVHLNQLPGDASTANEGGRVFFTALPPDLRERLWYDPVNHKLCFRGQLVESVAGAEPYYLLLNVITKRDEAAMLALSAESDFRVAIGQLSQKALTASQVPANTPFTPPLALTTGHATALGYVTWACGASPLLSAPDDPVGLYVIAVTCPPYKGEIKVIESGNPFDEKLTLRHSGDFAGRADDHIFEWRTLPSGQWGVLPSGDIQPPPEQWTLFAREAGAVDITIQGAGLFTLTDNGFVCRHRPRQNPTCATVLNPEGWSDWTEPMLAEGWIKRVLAGINPFEQRIKAYQDNQINTIVSMISQAGPRAVGNVPLNLEAANQFGLIETYETVLQRGMSLSIDGAPPVDYGPANDALLLAAGRLADLYMLLGNEAYADASDPTIAFGTDQGIYGAEASSIHCFMNQTASLLDEELALLRGRDDTLLPPFYNRLIWNFTRDINGGEVAYALNYNIRDQNGKVDGTINEEDAKRLYPQGHGDAWGHYLTAIKNYYRLLKNPHFTWVPQPETVLVGGVPVQVDFLDERKFAQAASARARAGAEIVNLTYRSHYVEDPKGQWQGYQDANTNRAWGLAEWGSRAGQGALLDWVVANALLPPVDPNPAHVGIQKVDRTTVAELRDILAAFQEIQAQVDKANIGLNPLGLAKNVIPFDIDPTGISQGKTHFEQVYDRAVLAMNNAIAVFNHAHNSTQLLRRQADAVADFQRNVEEREADFDNRLIELFGYPYADDIGPTGSYPSGYDGPDLYHYDYVDVTELLGELTPPAQPLALQVYDLDVAQDGALSRTATRNVVFHISETGLGLVKPAAWTGKRRAPGEIQMARSELIQTKARFEKALGEYRNLVAQIEDQASLLRQQYNVNANEIQILNQSTDRQGSLNELIKADRERALGWRTAAQGAIIVQNALAEYFPKVIGIATDAMAPARGAVMLAGALLSGAANLEADLASLAEMDHQQAKETEQALTNIKLTTLRNDYGILQQVAQIEQLVRQEASLRLEIYTLQETVQQTVGRYLATLARAQRLLEDRLRFRQQSAGQVQAYRYKDMAFRIFRNDALQKYRAQFDLAAMYVYMAAQAYDFETSLRSGDPRGPGQNFMTDIIRSRSLGLIEGGLPHTGSGTGDAGLADPIARLFLNWNLVLKGQLGFNNPETETGRFSLRSELFRIQAGTAGSATWRETLSRLIVPNVLDLPEFQRYCIAFTPQEPIEPAIVIPFSTTINFGQNFFGWPAGGGDNSYDSSHFVTKVRSLGVWFANYNNLNMINTPRVYLVPVGSDILRTPGAVGFTREWKILDQLLPVPFPLSPNALTKPDWIPINDTLADEFGDIRRYGSFRAYHDSGSFNPLETINNSRLIGRSVWNTRWLLVIPAGTLLADRNEGLQRFVHGKLLGNGLRDENGVSDIKIFFQTYSYAGN